MNRLRRITDVVDWRLCIGCGACAYICPENRIELRDFVAEGIRPVLASPDCGACRVCLDVCPSVQSDFSPEGVCGSSKDLPVAEWGPILGIWEGHASDPEIRFKGSSGGALTALGAYCLEVLGMHGVLHIAGDLEDPVRNRTRLSGDRAELLCATGSRYSPASVCNGLLLVEKAPGPCVVVGKPAEISGVRNARRLRPDLDKKIGLTLSFFCAETPSTRGTIDLLEKLGIKRDSLSELRYRGFGWPGHFAPVRRGENEPAAKLTYQESWAFLQAYRPWPVQLWPDGTGEMADISCGDPWYEKPDGKNSGFSLVVARTQRGREIVEGAIASGYLTLTCAETWKLKESQKGLIAKKAATWGRRFALRLFRLPVTEFKGLDLASCWRSLSVNDQIRSTFGTVRRILSRKLYRRLNLNSSDSLPVKAPVVSARKTSGLPSAVNTISS